MIGWILAAVLLIILAVIIYLSLKFGTALSKWKKDD